MIQPITLVRYRGKDGKPGPLVIPDECGPEQPFAVHFAFWNKIASTHPVNEKIAEHRFYSPDTAFKVPLFFKTESERKAELAEQEAQKQAVEESKKQSEARQKELNETAAKPAPRSLLERAISDAISDRCRQSAGLNPHDADDLAKLKSYDAAVEKAKKDLRDYDQGIQDQTLKAAEDRRKERLAKSKPATATK